MAKGFCRSRSCTQRSRLSVEQKGKADVPVTLTIAALGSDVKLPCHFCDETVGLGGRLWYRRDLEGAEREVPLDMHDDDSRNRVFADGERSLVIRGVTEKDGAYYQCRETGKNSTKMEILLDVGYRSTLEPHVLELRFDFGKKVASLMKPCEKIKKLSALSSYSCYAEWGPWSKCDTCGKIGKRRRVGECRLQKHVKAKVQVPGGKEVEADFPVVGVGCHSVLLNAVPPAKRILDKIPDVVLLDNCEVSCENYMVAATEMSVYKKSSFLKKIKVKVLKAMKAAKHTVTSEERQHPEGESITLFCPGTDLDTRVRWKFQNRALHPAKVKERTSGRVTVDALDTLHIRELRPTDAGEYVCSLDGAEVGLVRLKVMSKYTIFDPTTNFGILTIVMILSFLLWILLMVIKRKSFSLQREVQERRAMRAHAQKGEQAVEAHCLLTDYADLN